MPSVRRPFRRSICSFVLVGGLFGQLACSTTGRADLLVGPGDVLRITVAENPSMNAESRVNADGKMLFSPLGSVPVQGETIDAVRDLIQLQLTSRGLLKAPTVFVDVAKFRPIYVGGKVVQPGAVDYEPGLTVRHALILAGGLKLADSDANSLSLPELKAKWQTVTYALLQSESRVARLQAELARSTELKVDVDNRLVSEQDVYAVLSLDRAILHDRLASWNADHERLRAGLELLDLEIDVLKQQASLQDQERSLQTAQVAAAVDLVSKGLMPQRALQDLQREASRLARDYLDNQAFSARARQNRANVEHEMSAIDIEWRTAIRKELREAMLEHNRLKAELEGLSAQIVAVGASISERVASTVQPEVLIYRTVEGAEQRIEADMATAILPGDVIEVSVRTEVQG